jgi:hypothetical protein
LLARRAGGAAMQQTATDSGGGSAAVLVLLVIGLLVIIGIGVKLYDLKRKREVEAVHLQARVSDALMREPDLINLAVTPTASVPWWSGTPARLEVTGRVPAPEMREQVLRLAEREAQQVRPDVTLVDRLQVDTAMHRAA